MAPIKGDIYLVELPYIGNQQGGKRPVVVTQNDKGNEFGPRVHIVPLSRKIKKKEHLPTHVVIEPNARNGLRSHSVALAENLQSIQKDELRVCIGKIDDHDYNRIAKAIKVHLAI